jgi:hypothetical protein
MEIVNTESRRVLNIWYATYIIILVSFSSISIIFLIFALSIKNGQFIFISILTFISTETITIIIFHFLIIKDVKMEYIRSVSFDKKMMVLNYLDRSVEIPYSKIKVIVITKIGYVVVTDVNFVHSKKFRKGIVCDDWFNDRLSRTIFRKLTKKGVPFEDKPRYYYYGLRSHDGSFSPINEVAVTDLFRMND